MIQEVSDIPSECVITGRKDSAVLSVLAGEMSIPKATRKAKVSEESVANWKRQFIEAGRQGVAEGGKPGPNSRERALLAEMEEVKAALGEAHVQLRVRKRSAEIPPPH